MVNANSVTIHRVQDATLEKVHTTIDNSLFACGHAYVAFSRVRNPHNLHLKNFDPKSIKTDTEVVALYEYTEKHGIFTRQQVQDTISEIKAAKRKTASKTNHEYYVLKQYQVLSMGCIERLIKFIDEDLIKDAIKIKWIKII